MKCEKCSKPMSQNWGLKLCPKCTRESASSSEGSGELFDALTLLAEHDEEGRFGEKCDGEYECVCDDEFKPYRVIATFTAERLNDLIATQTAKLQAEARIDEHDTTIHYHYPEEESADYKRGFKAATEQVEKWSARRDSELRDELKRLERKHKIGEDDE